LGPKSGHWKRLTRKAQNKDENGELDHTSKKRSSPLPSQELEPSTLEQKRRKKKKQANVTLKNENQMGGRQLWSNAVEPNECVGMELPGSWITPGGLDSHLRGEIKKSDPSFPCGDQSKLKQNEGLSTEVRSYLGDCCIE